MDSTSEHSTSGYEPLKTPDGFFPEDGSSPEAREKLADQIAKVEAQLEDKRRRLAEVSGFFEKRHSEIRSRLLKTTLQEQELDSKLAVHHRSTRRFQHQPPGPKCLQWVDGDPFLICTAIVIFLNILIMCTEIYDPLREGDFFVLDSVIMTFYIFEFALRALLHQEELLCGPPKSLWSEACETIWSNWLDLIIVVGGVFDLWLKPLLFTDDRGWYLRYIQGLRVLRLARLVKLVKIFLSADLSWTEEKPFQFFISGVILVNAVLIGIETNFPDLPGFSLVDNVLLWIYVFELLMRLLHEGCRFFYQTGDSLFNWLEIIIVIAGVINLWLIPTTEFFLKISGHREAVARLESADERDRGIMSMLRLARIFRLLRLIRLIHDIPPLFNLATGIVESMQGMFWVFVLAVITLYSGGLVMTQLVGHRLLLSHDAPQEVADIFPSVGQSMFVLFKVMNGDTSLLEPIFEEQAVAKFYTAAFMIFTNWAVLAVLTAVVSENLITATEANQQQQNDQAQLRRLAELNEIFQDIDQSGNGLISRQEFRELLSNEEEEKRMCEAAGLKVEDLHELFELLCREENPGDEPTINHYDFVEALKIESQDVSERSMMRTEKRLAHLEAMIYRMLGRSPASAGVITRSTSEFQF